MVNCGTYSLCRRQDEQVVKRSKVSWFIKNGMKHKLMDIGMLCDIWEAWTFMVTMCTMTFNKEIDTVLYIFMTYNSLGT